MRLLDVDGEYGCIASWVTPEISEGGRKVVLHNEFLGKERELNQDEARILFSMTGNNDPIVDRCSSDICNSLWKESYIEKEDIREYEILEFAATIQESIDEENGVTGHTKIEVDETGEYVTELVCEEALTEAKKAYKEQWRTYSKSAHPMLWTVVLSLLGVMLFSFGATLLPRALISAAANDMEWELGGFLLMMLCTVVVFLLEGFPRDLCHGAVGRLFGARVIYKGFLNGSLLHGDWYLIDDSVVIGKYYAIRRMHIRLAGAYCDFLIASILSGVLLHTENTILYWIVSGMLFGILIRCAVHFFPSFLHEDCIQVLDAMMHANHISYGLSYFGRLFRDSDTRHELLAQRGIHAVGALLVCTLIVFLQIIGHIGFWSLIIFYVGLMG